MDVPRIIGIRFDLPSKASDQIVHASSERDILISPNIPQQLLASHDLAGALAHIAQHFDFALAEGDLFIVAFRSVPVEIDTERSKHEVIIGRMYASQDGVDSRQQF